MFHGGMLLDTAVAAVVVGEHKPFAGDNLTGAEVPEGLPVVAKADYGILKAGVVDIVDVFGSKFEALFMHLLHVLVKEHQQPHSFIRPDDSRVKQHRHAENH